MARRLSEFNDLKVSRPQLLQRYERIAKSFPKTSRHVLATETVALLKQMIKEDEEHTAIRKNGKPFDLLSKNEQVAELIFQLRDQNGHQWMQPGDCDIFGDFGETENDTAAAHNS